MPFVGVSLLIQIVLVVHVAATSKGERLVYGVDWTRAVGGTRLSSNSADVAEHRGEKSFFLDCIRNG